MSLQKRKVRRISDSLENMDSQIMFVQKRKGRTERVRIEKIAMRLEKLTQGLDMDYVDIGRITQKVSAGLFSGVTTCELDTMAAETSHMLSSLHTDYGVLAARIFVSNLHKETKKEFSAVIEDLYNHKHPKTGEEMPLINQSLYLDVMANKDELDGMIDKEQDYYYTYFGLKTLVNAYLKDIDGKVVERPQHLAMRIAVGLHERDLDAIKETYSLLAEKLGIFATPIQFNCGCPRQGMTSCFLLAASQEDDSIGNIYKMLGECAEISKLSGGIGVAFHNIRAKGSLIKSTNGKSRGIVPMLKVFNESCLYVTQSDKRSGSMAVYLEPWHPEIFEFLKLRENVGQEEFRARALFYGLWIPDLFMEKVKMDEDWYLFCPSVAPGLADVWGEDFNKLYYKYVEQGRQNKKVKARDLMYKIIESQIKTGAPYMLYKDQCNRKNNQRHYGTLQSSNLCTEILEFSSHDETSCCNLASLGLPAYVIHDDNGVAIGFDHEKLHWAAGILVRDLNKVIDKTTYPGEKARKSNMRHRPIGVGVSGLADTFAEFGYPFDSDEARKMNKEIFETIYHGCLQSSVELSKLFGPYDTFQGSEFSKGNLQFDLWEQETGIKVTHSGRYNWDSLKQDIMTHGTRNSLLTACMPTASTSQIIGYSECIEPFNRLVYKRETNAGETVVANKYLVRDLCKLSLWSEDLKWKILDNRGSIKGINEIPADIRKRYETAFDVKQRVIINMCAERGPYIDQSQSMNVFLSDPNFKNMMSLHFLGWEQKLKTGMYYLRQPAVEDPVTDRFQQSPTEEGVIRNLHDDDYQPRIGDGPVKDIVAPACRRDDPECLMCSS